jgi:CheY-like chemotaxis protein
MCAADKLHVLVVENNPIDREVIRRGLESLDVDCTTYEDGEQAVSSFKRNTFDGVILDKEYCHTGVFAAAIRSGVKAKRHIPIMLYSNTDESKIHPRVGVVVLFEKELHNTLCDFIDLLKDKNNG